MDDAPNEPAEVSSLTRALVGYPEWHTRYHPGYEKHLHALGVIAANYNHLEFALFALFYLFLDLGPATAQHLFAYLTNDKRIDILSKAVEAREKDLEVTDRILHFIQGFKICTENRNLLLHSMTEGANWNVLGLAYEIKAIMTFRKSARGNPTKVNYLHLRLEDIRKAADQTYDFDVFGLNIYLYVDARRSGGILTDQQGRTSRPTLPEKPPLPDKLSLSDSPTLP
jgi:hypothetical protein